MLNWRGVTSLNRVGTSLPVSVQRGLDCHLHWAGLHPPEDLATGKGDASL